MSLKYRDREEIILSLLSVLEKEPKTKTRLMYDSYLSYSQTKGYVKHLLQRGLIVEDKENKFVITDKGCHVLQILREIYEMLGKDFEQVLVTKPISEKFAY